ncbi:MAG: hypothetical protein H6742_19950 [Alphaproteobacteria bacterium]|nr:hypothetical protein [Alphaproteobacteria bacterium]
MAAPLLWGCAVEDWRNADLQLEIAGVDPGTQAIVRTCVDGVGSRDAALGAGRVAFPGLPTDGDLTVTVDVLETADTGSDATRSGRAGPITFSGDVIVQQAAWTACDDADCPPCREAAAPVDTGAAGRLLAVRFLAAE